MGLEEGLLPARVSHFLGVAAGEMDAFDTMQPRNSIYYLNWNVDLIPQMCTQPPHHPAPPTVILFGDMNNEIKGGMNNAEYGVILSLYM